MPISGVTLRSRTGRRERGEMRFGAADPPVDALCVVGHSSHLGGADTELDHQSQCSLAMGIDRLE